MFFFLLICNVIRNVEHDIDILMICNYDIYFYWEGIQV